MAAGASYEPHEEYLQNLLRSRFCFAPRGDTASAKRLYEAIAAGCIPIVVSDKLRLPFESQVDWPAFSLRYKERDVADDPRRVLRDVQAMPTARIDAMRQRLLAVRHMFLWHTDPNRPSAVDYVLHEMCAWAKVVAPPAT